MNVNAPHGLPRLLAGLDASGVPMDLDRHDRIHGPLPQPSDLISIVERSGLRGRGGADFPTAVKLRAVAARRGATLIVNGSETEPASAKDALLLERLPHLVLDGAILAAEAVGAREVIVVAPETSVRVAVALEDAIEIRTSRELPIRLHLGPAGYVSGEETAVVNSVGGGPAKPTFTPPRPYERGLRGRPTLIQNAETLAQIALIGRYGAAWYRELGTSEDPGSVLVTISGAVGYPGVYELAFGTPVRDLLEAAGGTTEPLQAILIGGYFGTWVGAADAQRLALARSDLKSVGCSLGAGIVLALGQGACGLHESARIAGWLADQSAGQCGPCVHGLAAIADGMARLARGVAPPGEAEQLRRWCADVRGRGACHHPNGVVRFVESTLSVFAQEIPRHRAGRCGRRPAGLPLSGAAPAEARASGGGRRGWG
jgi:NADH:ubiquinone oxidoreductase subunit F (NADH-binding)